MLLTAVKKTINLAVVLLMYGVCKEAPPRRGTFLRLQEYKKVSISQVYERVGKSVI